MKFNKIETEDGVVYQINEEGFTELENTITLAVELQEKVDELNTQLEEKNATITKLENSSVDKQEDVIPEKVRLLLVQNQEQIKRLETESYFNKLTAIITKAHNPVDGKVHAPVLLTACRNAVFGLEFSNTSDTINLEDINRDKHSVVGLVQYLLENLPRTVILTQLSEKDTSSELLESVDLEVTKLEAANLWKNVY